ncbi:putative LrgB-like family protein [Elsinoe australis]|uniref:Putative LrgB-like family protein n=1 Tax=Elsinoe australis TaxID=40998 RepID=A0A4U7AQC8_9PEZI|nr:putative LrgB-like family protein [Elsinoe australis]
MAVCFGVHRLISLAKISFPASVACMILLFVFLILCEVTLGDKTTKKLISLIDVPCGFGLRYINLFFCPAFVTLPLSPDISGAEVGKIIAVFGGSSNATCFATSLTFVVIGYAALFSFTAYFVRGLQLVLGTSKRAITERAEEMGREDDNMPLTERTNQPSNDTPATYQADTPSVSPPADTPTALQPPTRTQDPSRVTGTGGPPLASTEQILDIAASRLRHDSPTLSRSQEWATWLTTNLDLVTYWLLFLFVGLPIYYTVGYAMPAQIAINIICFLIAVRLPTRYKTYLHPVLVSSAFTIVGIWIFALIHRKTLNDGLTQYTTGSRYTQLWELTPDLPPPGPGDIFGSVLDVSIVALGLPMFQYRQELKSRFVTIIIPNISLSVGSLLAYPALCHAIGISGPRSLAFASRSLTLALATPATQNLGGDLYTVAPLCIFSGIVGVVVGPWALKTLKVPEDDYITRGVTLGANSSAVATALLLTSDPRAAAFSSLSMGLFGTITVALTSVPPFVSFVRGLVGLP